MFWLKKSKWLKVAVHSGSFHADDVCAVAVLHLLHGGKIDVIRSRQESDWKDRDIILDVGGVYDGKRFFDHHQNGGAGERENGIPYASFGLIWKHFGKELIRKMLDERVGGWGNSAEKVFGGKEGIAAHIDAIYRRFDEGVVQFIDAGDNGMTVAKPIVQSLANTGYLFHEVITVFNPTWKEDATPIAFDDAFQHTKMLTVKIMERQLVNFIDDEQAIALIHTEHKRAVATKKYDPRLVVIEEGVYSGETLRRAVSGDASLLYLVHESRQGTWYVESLRIGEFTSADKFTVRKPMPEAWAGLQGAEMARVSGVSDAIFCHRGRHLVVANSLNGALALATKALAA